MSKCKSCQTSSNSWKMCSFIALGSGVHSAAARALHLTDSAKVKDNLVEAQYYLDQMQKKLDDIKENL